MFSFFSSAKTKAAQINGLPVIEVKPKETILQAALEAGIQFPHNCRVGGCASCKCKLIDGEVKELTESSYVLSEQELDEGYILACQSTPKSDVSITVDLDAGASTHQLKSLSGKVIGQTRLTHDITALEIELPEAMPFTAGQYANLALAGSSSITRSYSFATAPGQENRVLFYIREMPGGAFSPIINQQDLLNREITVEGPFGDFHLGEKDSPLLLIAGGSGLAPIKAILEQAVNTGEQRDAVFLFGARTRADLYCIEELAGLEKAWKGSFKFIPILSDEAADSSWTGARGLVTEVIGQYATGREQAYLCGPPGMIDVAIVELRKYSISAVDIHFDKFFSQADTQAA